MNRRQRRALARAKAAVPAPPASAQAEGQGDWERLANEAAAEEIRPEFASHGTVMDAQAERNMRRMFMAWEEGWRKRTVRSDRAAIDSLPRVTEADMGGLRLPMVVIAGNAAGIREFPDGTARLLLSCPVSWAEDGSLVVLDDHLWLDAGKGSVESKTGRAEVRYGDLVFVTACVESYDGGKRLGTGMWVLKGSGFYYTDVVRKRQVKLPRCFGDDSLLLAFEGGRVSQAREEARFQRYLASLAAEGPNGPGATLMVGDRPLRTV